MQTLHSSKTKKPLLTARELRGLLLPITTPFGADGSLDLDALRFNITKWNETGIAGYVVAGSTGERVHLDETEYIEVLKAARESISPDHIFIAGAGQQSTFATIREIERACSYVQLDAVLVITPHFYRPAITQPALLDHYQRIADAAPVPVILYSMPPFTGIVIEPQTAATLSAHPNIIGIKDSSSDVENLGRTVSMVQEDFAVLLGNGTVLNKGLAAGAHGAILAVGCVAPELCLEIMRSVFDGDSDGADSLQARVTPLATAVTTEFGIGGLKAALDMIGWKGGFVQPPLRMPDETASQKIADCLKEAAHAAQVAH